MVVSVTRSEVKRVFCSKCGAKVPEGSRFCNGCGAQVGEAPVQSGLTGQPARPQQAPSYVLVIVLVVAIALVLLWTRGRGPARVEPPPPPQVAVPAPPPDAVTEDAAADEVQVDETVEADGVTGEEPAPEPEPAPAPVPAEDPVAEATVVLENYLAADLGHDGNEMAKYLGGQAAARFRPEVQGQEDVTVYSKKVSGHTVKDANTIVFKVAVRWSMEDGGEAQTTSDRYTVRRTTKGWRITSTPEYP